MCSGDDSLKQREREERRALVAGKYGIKQSRRSSLLDNSDFQEADVCHRCHTRFSVITRRHHCRRCRKSFCASHSARTCSQRLILEEAGEAASTGLPSVRVCDNCFFAIKKWRADNNGGATSF